MAICIRVENLTKCFGSLVAVGGVSFEIETGEVLGLLGPNGAGKTTTLNMLSGLVPPTSGSVSIFGKDLRKGRMAIMRRVGVMVEQPRFYPYLTARKNLRILAQLAGVDVNVDRVLDRVGLLQAARQKVGGFSQGMRQRLGLAQAILTEPEVLILDEPTTGLDIEATIEFLQFLRSLSKDAKVTILFSSHMLHEVESLCDRVAIMNRGRMVSSDNTDSLLSYDPSHVEVLTDSAEAAARRLAEEGWVESAEAVPGKVVVRLKSANVHQLIAFLLGQGYLVNGVIPRRRSLHDYFMKVLNS